MHQSELKRLPAMYNSPMSISEDAYRVYRETRVFAGLDGVRGLCISGVLWHHCELSSPGMPNLLMRGFLGVDMFFVLSGFLIVTLLIRERESSGDISLVSFYMRRALRIFPLYYGLLVFLTVLYLLIPGLRTGGEFFSTLPWYLLYLSNWCIEHAANLRVTWSLAAEEQFYLVWPLLEKFLVRIAVFVVLVLGVLINQLINFGALDPLFAWLYGLPSVPKLEILDATFTPILLGVLLAHLLNDRTGFVWVWRLAGGYYAPLLWGAGLLLLISGSPGDISGWPRLMIQLSMMLLLGGLVVQRCNALSVLLCNQFLGWLGRISYGVYLLHPWGNYVGEGMASRVGMECAFFQAASGFVATLLMAATSFYLYEKPILSLKRHWLGGGGGVMRI